MTPPPVATPRDVSAAQTAFGLAVLRAVAAGGPDEDVLLSPASAASVLGMLYPGLSGPRADALGALLRLPSWTPELAAVLGEHTRALDGLRGDGGDGDSLRVSNRLWAAVGVEPPDVHLDAVATAFAATVGTLDLPRDPGGTTDRVNAAVAADTGGLVDRLFAEPLAPDTVLLLTNAVHLRARWASRFTSTEPAPFAAPSGEVEVPMMGGAAGTRRTVAGWQAVELPYRDRTLAALVVLPPEGADPASLDAALLTRLVAAAPEPVDVRLPRLRLAQSRQLLTPLVELGLPVVLPELGPDARVDRVVQQVVLDVDEDGTVAAAATGLAVVAASFRLPRPVVTVDRPFLLLLTGSATGAPLVLAVVRRPSPRPAPTPEG